MEFLASLAIKALIGTSVCGTITVGTIYKCDRTLLGFAPSATKTNTDRSGTGDAVNVEEGVEAVAKITKENELTVSLKSEDSVQDDSATLVSNDAEVKEEKSDDNKQTDLNTDVVTVEPTTKKVLTQVVLVTQPDMSTETSTVSSLNNEDVQPLPSAGDNTPQLPPAQSDASEKGV